MAVLRNGGDELINVNKIGINEKKKTYTESHESYRGCVRDKEKYKMRHE